MFEQNLGLCIWKGLDQMTLKSSFQHLLFQGLTFKALFSNTFANHPGKHVHLWVQHLTRGMCTIKEHFLMCVSQFHCDIPGGCLAAWLLLPLSLGVHVAFSYVWGSFHFLNNWAILIQKTRARPMPKPPCSQWEQKKTSSAWQESTSDFESPNSLLTNIVIRVKPWKPRFRRPSGLLFGERKRTFQPWGVELLGLLQMTLYFTWLRSVSISSVMDGKCCAEKHTDVFQDLDRMGSLHSLAGIQQYQICGYVLRAC